MTIYAVFLNESSRYTFTCDRLCGYAESRRGAEHLLDRCQTLYDWAHPKDFRVEQIASMELV